MFCVADIQTGFGPFVAVFLTTEKWTQVDIGLVLTVSGLVSLIGQVPLGALVDASKSLRGVSALSLTVIGASAFAFALWPIFGICASSRACCTPPPVPCSACRWWRSASASSARTRVSERLGRNAAFASAGTGNRGGGDGRLRRLFFQPRGVLSHGRARHPRSRRAGRASTAMRSAPRPTRRAASRPIRSRWLMALAEMMRNKPFLAFAFCIMAFHLANAAMLPLAASMLTLRSREAATIMVAAAIVVPQFTMAALSPWVGRTAHRRGRRPLLLLGFAALALRGFLFSVISAPELLVLAQVLDGVSAATLAVLVPLTMVDLDPRARSFQYRAGHGRLRHRNSAPPRARFWPAMSPTVSAAIPRSTC